jgi:hypothetical protein
MRGAIPPLSQYVFILWCLVTGTTSRLPSCCCCSSSGGGGGSSSSSSNILYLGLQAIKRTDVTRIRSYDPLFMSPTF